MHRAKNIIQATLLILSSFTCFGYNRIATISDQQIYGDYITPGDLIIDTHTKDVSDGKELVYYFMAKQWPELREGGTIWFDGKKLGFIKVIKLCNTSSATMPWHIQSARIKNIPDTQVRTAGFACSGLKHLELDGESSSFPGLSDWPESRKFLTGSFGFHVISKMFGGHDYNLEVLDGGTIKLKGIEAQHGFSGIRINGGNYNITLASVEITNFYVHDTGDGEGIYLGATHAPPYAKIKNLKIYNGIFTRTAAEAMQLQHLVGGADVHHVTIRSADVRWMNEFMAGQDTGIQWSVDEGINNLHHIIVDGYGSAALLPFGSDQNPVGGVSTVSHILFNDGIDTGMYLHKSGSYGVHWIFENIYYRSFGKSCYYEGTGRKERKYIISSKNGKDRYTFNHIVFDGSKQNIFQDTSRLEITNSEYKVLPKPEYINSGFHEPGSKIKQWARFYAKYFPASKAGTIQVPTDWQMGDIAIETEGEYSFYKCILSHTSTEDRPGNSDYFVKITWDEEGVRSDQPSWNAATKQSNFPPDDLRLKENNYWKKLGLGIQQIIHK